MKGYVPRAPHPLLERKNEPVVATEEEDAPAADNANAESNVSPMKE